MRNSVVYVYSVDTLAEQNMSRGATPDPTNNAMQVFDAPHAGAYLRLDNVRAISAPPSNKSAHNWISGLFDTTTDTLHCRARVGIRNNTMHVQLSNQDTRLRTDCLQASTLRLENNQGECLQTVWTAADTVVTSGNGSIVVFPDPLALPSVVDVSGLASGDNKSTRVLVYLSEWQQDGQRGGTVEIIGKLPFAAQDAIVVRGCGTHRVKCAVTDKIGRPACQVSEACVATQKESKDVLLRVINSVRPCEPMM